MTRRRRWATIAVAATLASGVVGGSAAAQDATQTPGEPPLAGATPVSGVAAAQAGLTAETFETIIPTQLMGLELETLSYSGDDIVAGADEDDPIGALAALAESNGATISDLFVASGTAKEGEVFVGVLAATIAGVAAADFAAELTPLMLELGPDVVLTNEVIAGLEVTRVGPGSGLTGEAPVYVIEVGEVVWYVVAEDELLKEIIGSLP